MRCVPRDQANPFAYKYMLPLKISYINGMLDHGGGGGGGGGEAVKMLKNKRIC